MRFVSGPSSMYRSETVALPPDLRGALERVIAAAPSRAGIAVRFTGKTVLTILAIAAVLYGCAALLEYLATLVFPPRRPCVLTTARGPLAAIVPLTAVVAIAIALWVSQLEWRSRQSAAAAARRALASGSVRRITIEIDERHRIVECDEAMYLLQPDETSATIIVCLDALDRLLAEDDASRVAGRTRKCWTIDVVDGLDTPLAFAESGQPIVLDADGMLWLNAMDFPSDVVDGMGLTDRIAVPLERILAKAQPFERARPSAKSTAPDHSPRPDRRSRATLLHLR